MSEPAKGRPQPIECPYCGKLPDRDFVKEMTESHKRNLYGIMCLNFGSRYTAWCSHICGKRKGSYNERKIYAEGRAVLWGDYNRDRPYNPEDIDAAIAKAEDLAVKKYNRLVRKLKRAQHDSE